MIRATRFALSTFTCLLAASLFVPSLAESSKMKMTTDVPPGIATPDRLETRLGTLTSFDGVPDRATAQKIYDNLDFQHGVQAFLSGIQIASMHALREGTLEFGPPNTTAVLFRLYGPLEPWFDKTWRPGDPEVVQ